MRRADAAVLVLAMAAVGCASGGGEPRPAGAVPVSVTATRPPPPTEVTAAPVDAEVLLVVPGTRAPAPWLEAPIGAAPDPELAEPEHFFADARLVSYGGHAIVVETPAGVFGAHEALGVVGRLRVPEQATWVGIDADDAVFAATKDGELFAAADLATAASKGFARVGTVPGATTWDSGKHLIVAGRDDVVSISIDGGATFSTSVPRKGAAITAVFARADGVLLAIAGRAYVSRDRGKLWEATDYVPKPPLRREGAWIWNGKQGCPEVLARDGRQWDGDEPKALARPSWLRWFETRPEPRLRPRAKHVTALDPPAPFALHPLVNGDRGCGQLGTARVVRDPRRSACEGPFCLRAPGPAPPTRVAIALLGDGECDRAKADEPEACAPGARVVRAPKLVALDRAAGATAVTPPCAPVRTFAAAGVGIATCNVGQAHTRLLVIGRDGSIHEEGEMDGAPEDFRVLAASADGTLVLSCAHEGRACPAAVRRPKPLGDAAAWRRVEVGSGALRPWVDGSVIALSHEGDVPRFALELDAPDATRVVLAKDVSVEAWAPVNDVVLDAAGHVLLTTARGPVALTRDRRLVARP